jgi:DNA (cytosine-5)-methyltransferase 1
VKNLSYERFEGIDVLSAGAPCQPFSQGGRLRGEDDERNKFPEVVRAIREAQPRAFILENVRGLLFPRVRPYFEYLLAELRMPSRRVRKGEDWTEHLARLRRVPKRQHDYCVEWRILNAADFGLAQCRPRLVVVGLRDDEGEWTWPTPTYTREALIDALWRDEYWDEHGVSARVRNTVRRGLQRAKGATGRRWRTLRDLTKELGPPPASPNGDPSHVLVPGARLYARHTGSRLDWPAKTIKAGVHGAPGGEHIILSDNGRFRYLTVRECAMLQGFPRRYKLPDLRSHAMRQLGNAVPVPLAAAVGTRLRKVLDG